jgi:peptidoglycan/LPS O-acetylase OafA/YrhL
LFYTRRFFRIAPLLYVMLAVTLLRDFIMWRATHSPAEVAENLFFVFNLVPGKQTGIVWASWSIGVEVVFYVLFPVFYFWAKDIFRACMLLLGAVALAMAFRISLASYSATAVEFFPMSFLRHLPIFALGIAAFRFYERFGKHQIRPAEAILLVITLVIFDASALTLDAVFDDAYYLQGPWFVALLLGLAVRPVSLLVNKVTKALGKLSYSLYLIHPPLILMMIPIYRRVYAWNLPLDVKYWVVVVLTFGVLITISSLSYRFLEEPGIRLGKRIARTDRMMPVEKSA